ncbi:MAG TPA: peptidoglycan-binding protein [Ktedonobacteraceae bacterium]|nr:peptidoglycan-binding protein [Ktedonobacteraceae bacterium]
MRKRLFLSLGISTLLLLVAGTTLAMMNLLGAQAATWPTYKNGSTGENVRSIQYMLRQRGYNITADGDFGPATQSAVKSFQSSKNLSVDGVVGPNTWAALIVTTQSGSNGNAVTALQRQLNAHGSNLSVDGDFGSATLSAVKSFQSAKNLSADGVAGANTWNALVGTSGGGSGGGGGSSSGKLSQSQAASMLHNAGVAVSSSGNCSTRSNAHCTSLDQIRAATINGVIAFKNHSGCAVTVTGGTEVGHASGTYSHYNGYKVDISHTSCVTNYIHSHFTYKGLRGDGAPMYDDASGNRYADEGNHWDITYY